MKPRPRAHTHTHARSTHAASQSVLWMSVCLHFRNISVSVPIQHLGYSNRPPVRIMTITVLSDVIRLRFGRRVPILRSNIKHQFSHCLRFTNSSATNKCTVSLLCIYNSYLASTCFGITAIIRELTPYYLTYSNKTVNNATNIKCPYLNLQRIKCY